MLQLDRLGQALRWLRLHRKLRQREVAQKAGITSSMLSSYESGKKTPTLATLFKILEAMDCALIDLVRALDLVAGEQAGTPPARATRVVGPRATDLPLQPWSPRSAGGGGPARIDLDLVFGGSPPLSLEEQRLFGEMLRGYCRWLRFLRDRGAAVNGSGYREPRPEEPV